MREGAGVQGRNTVFFISFLDRTNTCVGAFCTQGAEGVGDGRGGEEGGGWGDANLNKKDNTRLNLSYRMDNSEGEEVISSVG